MRFYIDDRKGTEVKIGLKLVELPGGSVRLEDDNNWCLLTISETGQLILHSNIGRPKVYQLDERLRLKVKRES